MEGKPVRLHSVAEHSGDLESEILETETSVILETETSINSLIDDLGKLKGKISDELYNSISNHASDIDERLCSMEEGLCALSVNFKIDFQKLIPDQIDYVDPSVDKKLR
jgi:hypothetical protein